MVAASTMTRIPAVTAASADRKRRTGWLLGRYGAGPAQRTEPGDPTRWWPGSRHAGDDRYGDPLG
ncbi:hypothetical protein GCM10028787_04980 [Brachybacterium horti]